MTYNYSRRLAHPFYANMNPTMIGKALDFYCHAAKLVIEVDGEYHNESDQQQYDEGRTHELNEMGLEIIRFTNDEVESNIDKVIEKIKEKLKTRIQVPPWFGEGFREGK